MAKRGLMILYVPVLAAPAPCGWECMKELMARQCESHCRKELLERVRFIGCYHSALRYLFILSCRSPSPSLLQCRNAAQAVHKTLKPNFICLSPSPEISLSTPVITLHSSLVYILETPRISDTFIGPSSIPLSLFPLQRCPIRFALRTSLSFVSFFLLTFLTSRIWATSYAYSFVHFDALPPSPASPSVYCQKILTGTQCTECDPLVDSCGKSHSLSGFLSISMQGR